MKYIEELSKKILIEKLNDRLTPGSIRDTLLLFIREEATYEQLLNLAFNPNIKKQYVKEHILELKILKTISEAPIHLPGQSDYEAFKSWLGIYKVSLKELKDVKNELVKLGGKVYDVATHKSVPLHSQLLDKREILLKTISSAKNALTQLLPKVRPLIR